MLLELAILRERLIDGKLSAAPEVRLRSNEFGLTSAGRQARRWTITKEDQVRARVRREPKRGRVIPGEH